MLRFLPGLFPTTGLPLPFISYGGTSLIFLCISIGILINIAISNAKRMNAVGVNTEVKAGMSQRTPFEDSQNERV